MTGNQRIDLGLTDVNAACSCCATDDAHVSHAAAASVAGGAEGAGDGAFSADYLVEGMTCSHCVSSVTEELSEVAGVRQVAVDLRVGAASVVTVTASGPISDDAVRAAVEEAGYTLAAPNS